MRPFGFEPNQQTIRESEANTIRDAANRLIQGESIRSVVQHLNSSGILTSGGNLWTAKNLRQVLSNPRVAGKRRTQQGQIRSAPWPAILDDVTFKRLSPLLEPRTAPTPRVPGERNYLFTGGLAVCGLCGAQLAARPNNASRQTYACVSDPPYSGCGRIRIVREPFEGDVVERLLARVLRSGSKRAVDDALARAVEDGMAADRELEELDARRRQLGIDYADGVITAVEMKSGAAQIKKRVNEARRRAVLRDQVSDIQLDTPHGLIGWWEQASVQQQSALVRALIDKIVVNPVIRRGSNVYDPDRVEVHWKK